MTTLITQEKNDVLIIVTGKGKHAEDLYLMWRCVGCEEVHNIQVGGGKASRCWTWDGSKTNPTITPSILKRQCEMTVTQRRTSESFKDAMITIQRRCHSFVTLGVVRFLSDCDHELAGQKVRMLPENANPFEEAVPDVNEGYHGEADS